VVKAESCILEISASCSTMLNKKPQERKEGLRKFRDGEEDQLIY
jgi:hypothetical protein